MKENMDNTPVSQHVPRQGDQESIPLEAGLEDNLRRIRKELGGSSDLAFREFRIGADRIPAAVLWINGMSDISALEQNMMSPLLYGAGQTQSGASGGGDVYEWLRNSVLTAVDIRHADSVDAALNHLLSGNAVILVDGYEGAVAAGTKGYETRSITEPSSTGVVRGPRDGFVESLGVNISLIRRRIKNKRLTAETIAVGTVTRTQVAMLYLRDKADEEVVDNVRGKLERIRLEGVLESHYIQELIADAAPSVFPTVYSTERPDDIAAGILEGRVALLVDGSPFALMVPCTFFHLMRTPEDYYLSYEVATFIRWIRYIGFMLTLLFPAMYVGIFTFHPEMVPPELLSSILAAREGVPFPLLLEALVMELTFEGLREASVRMPRAIGSAISIVGALVIGESAVNAGIISPPTVIVVAGTAIASFTIPSIDLSGAVRILRFFMLLLASLLGLYGIVLGLVLLGIHMASIKSAGKPYLSPLAPYKPDQAMKTLIRIPWWGKRSAKNMASAREGRR
ncbi:spore germination protein [Paenibacillus humicola]|uniref:spore germination protein n=1 Tax=Paenibacillus humicola TaxID=3110540 RepID=UPI00237A4D70|nr:spore germination protein [Paenibacillus humicola]